MKKSIYIIIVGAFALSSLTGCGLYKKYQRPDVSVDGIVRDTADITKQLPASADTTSFGDVAWQEVFTDPQLQSLIYKGLENNNDIYAAAANVQKLEAALSCARLAFLPSVVFSPSGTLSKVVTGDRKSDWSKSYALPISASWTVDIFVGILS
ncbi:MAG: TolC family protein, partial [Prevotella sp.]|nr:TolC family protein [Prevotella sp.]